MKPLEKKQIESFISQKDESIRSEYFRHGIFCVSLAIVFFLFFSITKVVDKKPLLMLTIAIIALLYGSFYVVISGYKTKWTKTAMKKLSECSDKTADEAIKEIFPE